MTAKNEAFLPEDVMIEILSWLPVKTLLQFKSICKSWYAIITSPSFISKHLDNYYCDNNYGCLLSHYFISPAEPELIELFPDGTLADLSHHALDLPIPEAHIFGPCNGIFYLDTGDFSDCGLWNPATKELKLLPAKITKPNLPPNISSHFHICGFGLDLITANYKVVVIQELWDDVGRTSYAPSSVIVYTLGTDSWRYWGDLARDYFLTRSTCYTYLNGVSYWWGAYEYPQDSNLILSFDLGKEVFEEIQVPDYPKPSFERLALYNDSIALFTVHKVDMYLDIWVINEGCWTKKFSMTSPVGVRNPVGYWKNGKLFLESDADQLMLCDPITKEIKDLGFQGSITCCEILIYKESLVSIKEGTEQETRSTINRM